MQGGKEFAMRKAIIRAMAVLAFAAQCIRRAIMQKDFACLETDGEASATS